eukprot:comp15000_c0_seq1/m.22242 comp15000_c0_seq1/g.22242  ORF comp15000_c0_seq1/g.22242 comp15000_c0_seq1/m.22242 type:complete len:244 (-) comp15000_c0_seq1:26-757(-)
MSGRLELVLALVVGFAVFALSSSSQNRGNLASPLMSSCDHCSKFLPMLLEVTGSEGTSEQLSDADAHQVCSKLPGEYERSCHVISQAYGLSNVDLLLATSPDLLCAAVDQCEKQAETLGYFKDSAKTSGDVLVSENELGGDLSNMDTGLSNMESSNDVAESTLDRSSDPLDTLRKMMQQRQMMQMQMQQQQMMQMQMMRMRLMSIMSSNREMKSRMNHMRRHIPGNCDCCQACPPPPEFAPVR